jgi:hypothetical protein
MRRGVAVDDEGICMKRRLLKLGVFLPVGVAAQPCAASQGMWYGTEPDVWGFLFLFNVLIAVVIGAVFLRTRKRMFGIAATGLALTASGIGLYFLTGWQIVPLVIAIAGSCTVLASGVIRPSL